MILFLLMVGLVLLYLGEMLVKGPWKLLGGWVSVRLSSV